MAPKNIEFTERLEKAIAETGLDYKPFAKYAKIGYTTLMNYLVPGSRGRVPKWDQLIKIAASTNKSIDWLLMGKKPAEAPRIAEIASKYNADSIDACPVNCEGNLREICRNVKYVIEDDGEFAEALKANIKAFKKSVELDRRVKNLEQSLSSGSGGGIPQTPAEATAKRRKAG